MNDVAANLNDEHRRVNELKAGLLEARDRYMKRPDEGPWRSFAQLLAEFARHMDRHFSFEEEEGFMIHVTRRRPTLAERVEALRREHEALRNDLRDLLAISERSHSDSTRAQLLGPQLDSILDRLQQHERDENSIVQEAFLQDMGR